MSAIETIKSLVPELNRTYKLEKPAIKQCYIAYLDMLGYKAFFMEHPDKIESLLDVLNNCIEGMIGRLMIINSLFENYSELKERFQIKVFSDNILVYFEYTPSYELKFLLTSFIELIKDFQINLIADYGIFLRGGITKGSFAVNDVFVFGQGLIDAVVLEEKKAIYPRVLIDSKIIADLDAKIDMCNSPFCKVCKELQDINKLFITGSPLELAQRVVDTYKTFDTIICAIPMIFVEQNKIESAHKNVQSQIALVQNSLPFPTVLCFKYSWKRQTILH